jgi:hypothetical protein
MPSSIIQMISNLISWILESGAIGILFGAVLAFAFTMLVEWLRKPRLRFSIESPPLETAFGNDIAQIMRVLRVHVFAKPLPFAARWMMRSPALRCRATISFHHLDGQNISARLMEGRWSNSPEPARPIGVDASGKSVAVLDPERLLEPSRIDIYPGQIQPIDVAARYDDEADCYGWNNESYAHRWRTPAWKLPGGRYLIRISVSSSGQTWSDVFRIVNDVPRTDFRLVSASREDWRRMKRSSAPTQ